MSNLKISEILISARTRRGVTLAGAADETKISIGHLEALERDDYDHFPNYALALGFLRSYLSFLDLDEDSISLQFQQAVDQGIAYKKNPLGQVAGGHVRPNYEHTMPTSARPTFVIPSFSLMPSRGMLMGLVGLLGVAVLGWVGYSTISTHIANKEKLIEWDGINIWEGTVKRGDSLALRDAGEKIADFTILEVSAKQLRFRIRDQDYTLSQDDTLLIDIVDTPREDMTIAYNGSHVTLRPILESERLITARTLQDRSALFPAIPFEFSALTAEDLQGPVFATRQTFPDLNPVTLTIRGDSLVRYLTDESALEEVFLRAGSLLDLSFATSLLLWVSNPQAVEVALGGQKMGLFKDQVLGIGQLIWVRSAKGFFEMRFLPL